MNNKKPHIAFINTGGIEWKAGTYYLRNLFFALKSLSDNVKPNITLLINPGSKPDESLISYIDRVIEIPKEPHPNRIKNLILRRLPDNTYKSLRNAFVPKSNLSSLLNKIKVDALFFDVYTLDLQKYRFNLPLLIWIPDFQHKHIPEAFTASDISRRDLRFSLASKYASKVILSSHDSLDDSKIFFPAIHSKAEVLPFVSTLPMDLYTKTPFELLSKYNLPERFIYLPNQFWKHKNHLIVVEALKIAIKKDPKIKIVCSGGMNDYRDPGYLPKLFTLVSEYNVRENFIILGIIPYDHLIQLMRQSLAILQPSIFEGWSSTVEEVKTLGKQIIISDIPVHREQNPPGAHFFNPNDPENLSSVLIKVFKDNHPGPDLMMETKAQQEFENRVTKFGNDFMKILVKVI